MSNRKPGMTVGAGQQIFGSDDVEAAERHQERQNIDEAYRKGRNRHAAIREDPRKPGSPGDDGYGAMTPKEKAAYKKGFRGQ